MLNYYIILAEVIKKTNRWGNNMKTYIWPLMILVSSTLFLYACTTSTMELDESYQEGPPLISSNGKADDFNEILAFNPLPQEANLEAAFQVLFAPDDPVASLELELIRLVKEARLADENSYTEKDNPYKIRYAVYNLRNTAITEQLISAHKSDVDVQIILEADQLDPARTWNTMDERLIEAGFEFVADHDDLDDQARITADLIGIDDWGLMHLKTRLFFTPKWSKALSGSLNPGDHAMFNEETLHLINDADLISAYHQAYQAVRDDQALVNQWNQDAAVNLLFTPAGSGPRASTRILEWLEEEDEQILLMVFSLRNLTAPGVGDSLIEILTQKHKTGIPVYIITDRKQSDGVDSDGNRIYYNDDTDERLEAAGIPVYEAINRASPYTAMHHKVAILGRQNIRIISDASNWTKAALGSKTTRAKNVESILFIDSQALDQGLCGRRYLNQFLTVLGRYDRQEANKHLPTSQAVFEYLQELEHWPQQSITFEVDNAYTYWGQHVWVVGDIEPLGEWFDLLWMLETGDNYPTWSSIEPLALPLGQAFKYKYVIASPHDSYLEWDWEKGDNRGGHAAPAVLSTAAELKLFGQWR
jgi:hypothetical protein